MSPPRNNDGTGIRARLHGVPRLPVPHVPRPRLVRLLDEAGNRPLTVVHAPAGYGKSTALSEWVRSRASQRETPQTLWLTVDDTISDRADFWDLVSVLLTGDASVPMLPPARNGVRPTIRRNMLRVVDALPEPVTLVVDAYERLNSPDIENDLLHLVHHTDTFSLVVATRTSTRLETFETLQHLDATVLAADNLAFTSEETHALDRLMGEGRLDRLDQRGLDELNRRSAGWPLALKAMLLQQQKEHVRASVTALPENSVERLHRLLIGDMGSRPDFDYLVTTSVVESFTTELAEALGARPEQAGILVEAEAKGAGSWNEDGTSFRLHPMVRQALSERLDEKRKQRLHRNLAIWHARHKRMPQAFLAAIEALDFSLAVRHAHSSFVEIALVVALNPDSLTSLPVELLHKHPTLSLLVGIAHYAIGNTSRAVRRFLLTISTSERAAWNGKGPPSVDQVWSQGALILALRLAGRYDRLPSALRRLTRMLHQADESQTDLESSEHLFVIEIAVTHVYLDDLAEADKTLASRPRYPASTRTRHYDFYADALTVLVNAVQGNIDSAQAALDTMNTISLPRGFRQSFFSVPMHLGAAHIELEKFDPESAWRELEHCLPYWPTYENWPHILTLQAQIVMAQSGPEAALDVLQRGLAEKHEHPSISAAVTAKLDAAKAELLLAAGRVSEAASLSTWNRRRTYTRLAVPAARALLIRGQFTDSIRTVDLHLRSATLSPRVRAHLLLVAASAELRTGYKHSAHRTFDRAARLALPAGLRLPFVAMPRDDFRVLGASLPADIRESVEATQDYFPAAVHRNDLTSRQRVILVKLAGPARLEDIAKELSISVNTVKKHVKALYRALGVSAREDAIAEAKRRHYL
ncbi:hypothetical protein GCM10027416_04730 [Okibacterium endophyticum]